jgi:hypothetical protein
MRQELLEEERLRREAEADYGSIVGYNARILIWLKRKNIAFPSRQEIHAQVPMSDEFRSLEAK